MHNLTVNHADRFNGEGSVAFVLGAGSSLGSVQAGMLRALSDRGIEPDLVVGSSVGALNGAVFAGQPTLEGAAEVEERWRAATARDFFPRRWPTPYFGLLRQRESLYPHDRVRTYLERVLPAPTFDALRVPFYCVATDAEDGQERWFEDGPLLEPVMASLSTPIMFPSVPIDGRRYIDGGTVNDVPVDKAAALGASTIYVLEVGRMHRDFTTKRPVNAGQRAIALARRHRFESMMARLPDHIDVHVLPNGDPPQVGFGKNHLCGEIIEGAYEASMTYLSRLNGSAMPRAPRSGSQGAPAVGAAAATTSR